MNPLTATCALALLLAYPLPASAADSEREANTVILDEKRVAHLNLETAEAEESTMEQTLQVLGRIEVLSGKKAVVSSRIPGRATTVIALPDMKCEEGDELVWIESRQPGDPPPVVRLDAPMSGIIGAVNVATGQPVSPEMSLVEIYDLSVVEAKAAVPEHLSGKLVKGQKARIRVPAWPDKIFEAELAHIGVEADTSSGTVEAAFHVQNPDTALRPGMRAEFSIITGERENVMLIPVSALLGSAAERFVYVKDFDIPHAFVKSAVVTGERNDTRVEIISGVLPGDEVVTRGAYALSFAGKGSVSLKEALDAAHGHAHNEDGSEMSAEDKAKAEAAKGGDGHSHDDGHDHEGVSKDPLRPFLILTSVLLLVLLILSMVFRPARKSD